MAAFFLVVAAVCGQTSSASGDPRPASRLHEAILAAQAGDGGKALRLTHGLLESAPSYEPALKFEGALLEDMGQQKQAAEAFRKAFAIAPNDLELMLKVGVYDLVDGDTTGAISLLTRRLKFAPHDGDALYYLAQAYHLAGANELALKSIKAAIKEDPKNPSLWQKYGELLCSAGDAVDGLTWLNKAKAADPTLQQIDLDLAVASFNNQDLDQALASANAAVERRPEDVHALTLLGSVDVKLARWQDAEEVYQRVLSIRKDDSYALLGLGHAKLELKQYQPAADSLERVLQQDPTQILAHFYLSRAYAGLGRSEDAEREGLLHRKMLEQGATLAHGSESDAKKKILAQVRQLLADGHEAEALKVFRGASGSFSETPGSADVLMGSLYLSLNRPEDAARCLDQALAVGPAVHGAHTYLGILALQQSEFDRAESEFNRELAMHPNDQMAMAEVGELRYRQGRWADAVAQISESKTAAPYLLFMLCESYFHLGKPKEADVTAELIVDYAEDDPEVVAQVIDLLERNQQVEFAQQLSRKMKRAS